MKRVVSVIVMLVLIYNMYIPNPVWAELTDEKETYTVISATLIDGMASRTFTLNEPVNIESFSLEVYNATAASAYCDVTLQFYNSSNSMINSIGITSWGKISKGVLLNDVKSIKVINHSRLTNNLGYVRIEIKNFILTIVSRSPAPPTQVLNLDVKNITSYSALITWEPNPEEVQKYIIYLNGQIYGETTDTEYMLDNLQPNTSYVVTVTAVNALGEGPASEPCIFTTPELPPEPATKVKNLVIKNMTSTSATISWTPNPEAEKITKYIIYLNGEKYGETEDTKYVIDGLKEGEKYTVTVAAVNALGEGLPSDPITFVPSKIADISNTIKIQDILSSIAILFTNLWPLIAFIVAVIAIVPITTALKQTITRRRSNA